MSGAPALYSRASNDKVDPLPCNRDKKKMNQRMENFDFVEKKTLPGLEKFSGVKMGD